MSLEDLRYENDGHLAIVTLDRPDARNAYSEAMIDSLLAAIELAEEDEAVRAIIITGAGKAFSAGGDLKRMRDRTGMFAGDPPELRRRYAEGIQRIPRRLARAEKPIVAALNGAAIGAGLDLACMCDIRIAARVAKLGSTFVKVGLVPGDGGAHFLSRVVGLPRALELMLTGRIVDAEEAQAIGLVHQLADDALEAAKACASAIAENAPIAVQLTKRAAYESHGADLGTALDLAATYQGMAQRTADHDEGIAAILEKRPPRFHGR